MMDCSWFTPADDRRVGLCVWMCGAGKTDQQLRESKRWTVYKVVYPAGTVPHSVCVAPATSGGC